jgi:hypothetical protein
MAETPGCAQTDIANLFGLVLQRMNLVEQQHPFPTDMPHEGAQAGQ